MGNWTGMFDCINYLKEIPQNSDNKPWAYICSKRFFDGLIFGGAYYWKEFCFSKWVGLDNKTASTNSSWAYIWEGLLSEGFLGLRFGGLIFGRAYFLVGLLSEFYGISIQMPIYSSD